MKAGRESVGKGNRITHTNKSLWADMSHKVTTNCHKRLAAVRDIASNVPPGRTWRNTHATREHRVNIGIRINTEIKKVKEGKLNIYSCA
jgi:hypothetical protein